VGKGTIDFDFLFEFLKDRGIEPLLTLEPHKEEHLTETLAGLERILARIHCPHTRAS
jgi:sugar phosphate isomerase/epimerase